MNFRCLVERAGKPVYLANRMRRPPNEGCGGGRRDGGRKHKELTLLSAVGKVVSEGTPGALADLVGDGTRVRSTGVGTEDGEFRFPVVDFQGRGGDQVGRSSGR